MLYAERKWVSKSTTHTDRTIPCHRINTTHNLQSNRRHSIQHPRHLIRRHLRALQTPYLTSLAQPLESKSQFPTLSLINEEDVFLAVGIADRGAEDVQVFGGLFARLDVLLVCTQPKQW
jgi:hypothetical protein